MFLREITGLELYFPKRVDDMLIGYSRASKAGCNQLLDLQRVTLIAAGVDNVQINEIPAIGSGNFRSSQGIPVVCIQ